MSHQKDVAPMRVYCVFIFCWPGRYGMVKILNQTEAQTPAQHDGRCRFKPSKPVFAVVARCRWTQRRHKPGEITTLHRNGAVSVILSRSQERPRSAHMEQNYRSDVACRAVRPG